MLVQILHPGEGRAGQQEQQPHLRTGVPQQINGNGVVTQDHHPRRQGDEGQKEPQAPPEHLGHGGPVALGVELRGQVGHRHRQPHGGEGHQDGIHRHNELIQPHDLRPDEPREENAVDKAHRLGTHTGTGEDQCAVDHGRAFQFQSPPPFSLQLIRERAL